MARIGWLVKGVMFILMGFLAFKVLAGELGEEPDMQGAISTIAEEPAGLVALWGVALGLLFYAFWRLTVSILDTEEYGSDLKGTLRRLGFAVVGGFYAFLGASLVTTLVAGRARQEGGEDVTPWVAQLFELPIGPWLLGAAGVITIGVGLFQAIRALRPEYEEQWDEEKMTAFSKHLGKPLSRIGMPARGVAFGALGYYLIRSAWTHDPEEAKDMGETVAALAEEPILLAVAAGGLILYGLHCLLNARYRTIGGEQEKSKRDVA